MAENMVLSQSIENLLEKLSNLELQNLQSGLVHPEPAAHLLSLLYVDDLNNARLLWKRLPPFVKEENPDLLAAWNICLAMWNFDWKKTQEAFHYEWSPKLLPLAKQVEEKFRDKVWILLSTSYSTILVQDAVEFLGLDRDTLIQEAFQRGWRLDTQSKFLEVVPYKQAQVDDVSTDRLQNLTEYVVHLEH